jgi:hypothetical protein
VFSITCDFDVPGSSGEFISSEFESSEDCRTSSWVITAPLNHNIRLKFVTFQLSDMHIAWLFGQHWIVESYRYFIQIYDGRNTNNTLLGVFTGAIRPFVVQSSGHFMLVKLIKEGLDLNFLSNFKGVYTFNTTKGKFSIIYLSHTNSSEQIKINMRKKNNNVLWFVSRCGHL